MSNYADLIERLRDLGVNSADRAADAISRLERERAVYREALEEIAKASTGEGGCFYTNRWNITVARKALSRTQEQTA